MNRWFSDQRAVHCPACRGTSFDSEETRIAPFVAHRMLDGRDATFVHECHWCGLLWVEVFPSPGQLAAHYNGYMGEEYLRQRERYEPDFHARHPYINRPRGLRLDNEEYITNNMRVFRPSCWTSEVVPALRLHFEEGFPLTSST